MQQVASGASREGTDDAPILRRRFSRAALTFLLVGGALGFLLALAAPRLTGIDEDRHFARAVQLTDRIAEPQHIEGHDHVGVCLPYDIGDATRSQVELNFYGGFVSDEVRASLRPPCARADGSTGVYYDVATFSWYSPLGYLPQAMAVGIGRALSLDPMTLTVLSRLACLASYLALVTIAIQRSPRARWAFVAVGLLPVALSQAAMAAGPDAMALAMTMVVVSSALRLSILPVPRLRSWLLEAVVLATLLGFTKPTYAIAALAYLLVLRRDNLGPRLAVAITPLVTGIGLSGIWYATRQQDFACDVDAFNITPDPDGQMSALLHRPYELVIATVDAFKDLGPGWMVRLVAPHDETFRNATNARGLAATVLVLVGALALVLSGSDRDMSQGVSIRNRVLLVGIAAIGVLAVIAGWLRYCNPPGLRVMWPPHVRLLLPPLVLAAVALVPTRGWPWLRARGPIGLPYALLAFAPGVTLAVTNLIAHPS